MPSRSRVYTRTVTPGKKGVNIDRDKYEVIRQAILEVLRERGEVPFADLPAAISKKLPSGFKGDISWYTTWVKLEMERLKLIQRVPNSAKQLLRIRAKRSSLFFAKRMENAKARKSDK